MSKITLTEKPGWINRHLDGLPNVKCKIIVLGINEFINKEVVCIWNPTKYEKDENFLGYAEEYKFTLNKFKKLGFSVFKNSDYNFVYYKLYEETWLEKLIDRFIKLFK